MRVSVPLRGVGCFNPAEGIDWEGMRFPSPCGVWVVSILIVILVVCACFRPLAGCGLFRNAAGTCRDRVVSVPLRGMGCFGVRGGKNEREPFPSPCGVWVVSAYQLSLCDRARVSVPLRGMGCFSNPQQVRGGSPFPSPCGVWVVSAKLHILSGATGKRIVNSAILLYHIGRCLSIAN